MKKNKITVIAISLLGFLLAGCVQFLEFLESSGGLKAYQTKYATITKTWDYKESPIFEIDDDVKTVNISNLPRGKHLYYAKVNPTQFSFNFEDTRFVTTNSGRAVTTSDDFAPIEDLNIRNEEADLENHLKHYQIPEINRSSCRAVLTPNESPTDTYPNQKIDYKEGSREYFWINDEKNDKAQNKRPATLQKIGTYCYVWVVDGYYSSNYYKTENQVSKTDVEAIQQAFDTMYPYITHVFGNEFNYLVNDTYYGTIFNSMNFASKTGNKINIIVFDINGDYTSTNTGSVMGYCATKDFYSVKNVESSNEGKCFYLDSAYVKTGEFKSTLPHEFQHMLMFSQKIFNPLKKGFKRQVPSTSYSEMLAMLAEDMLQEKLEIPDAKSPKQRLAQFVLNYPASGINEYNQGYPSISYANFYAFGSWLARQYGGAELIKEMTQNECNDLHSITAAVNKLNPTNFTFDELFQQFLLALLRNSKYTHNQDANTNISYGIENYTFPMKAIDLFETRTYQTALNDPANYTTLSQNVYADYGWKGPVIFKNRTGTKILRPNYGITLHGIAKTDSLRDFNGKATIDFSAEGAVGLKIYLIVQ